MSGKSIKLLIIIISAVGTVFFGPQLSCDRGSEGQQAIRPLPATAEILFVSNRDTGTSRKEIYAMDAKGGNVARITSTDQNHFVVGIDASRRYVVATRGKESQKCLWLLDLQTREETPLTDAANHAEGRNFSPDGEWIVFWMILSGETQADIHKIRRDGSWLTNLTNSPVIDFDPAWSSDGTRIAFISNTGYPICFVLKTMSVDGNEMNGEGSDLQQLNTSSGWDEFATWIG